MTETLLPGDEVVYIDDGHPDDRIDAMLYAWGCVNTLAARRELAENGVTKFWNYRSEYDRGSMPYLTVTVRVRPEAPA